MEHLILSPSNWSRRVFIRGIGFISLGLLLGPLLGGCEEWAESIRNRPVRRRLRTGSPEVDAAIATYRNAVKMMKDLSRANAADKRGWTYQAAIHGTAGVGFNFCQHGTNHFFSWHRAYLFYFEKICQKLTGDDKFGLLYWNWNQDPQIHSAFLDPASNLFLPRSNTTMAGVNAVSTPVLNTIISDSNFFTFSQQLEGSPHNAVHGWIGGTMGSFGSAMDPLFWTHHCMVDYCWNKWNIELENDNTNDQGWLGTHWTHFVDGDGNPADVSAAITTLMPLLSYRYESSAIGDSPASMAAETKETFNKVEKRVKEGANIKLDIKQRVLLSERVDISIATPFFTKSQVSASTFAGIINNDQSKERVFVSVAYANLPETSDFFVRVFINNPNASPGTLLSDPHYAGSFVFFGTSSGKTSTMGEHHHQPSFLVNISPVLAKLRDNKELREDSEITVQLVAVPFTGKFEKAETRLQLNKVELIVTPVLLKTAVNK